MNELTLISKIEKRLREKREPIIFPLTPTHRKELRQLRDMNIGNLQDRLRIIKKLKKEEYKGKYTKDIEKELKEKENICKSLNDDWKKRIEKINRFLQDRQKLEKKYNLEFINLNSSYGTISRLEVIRGEDREFKFNKERIIEQISDREFEKQYGKKFDGVQKKIDDIVTKYEEAINFGDLEIVKELYYIMKTADNFFTKINELEI